MDKLLEHKGFTAFKQLSIKPEETSGNQGVADCPFCGGTHKLYINPEKKMFDCKSCGISGGFKTLMTEMHKLGKKSFRMRQKSALERDRQLPRDMFERYNMGYLPDNGAYILPIPVVKGGRDLWDIRIYKNKKFMSLSGCHTGMFGWDHIKSAKKVYITEGEWDKMALDKMLEDGGEDAAVVSVPGAQTFKRDWVDMFARKHVIIAYDHDDPGRRGANKAGGLLKGVASKIEYVIWPEDSKDGYDVRDFYVENNGRKTILRKFHELIGKDAPDNPDGPKTNTAESSVELDSYDGEYVPRDEVHKVYRKWLHLPDTDVLDVMYGAILANRLEGDPLWLFLVAPPGGTKTELINSVSDAANVETTSSLTPRSLVSGANTAGGGDPSLIPRLDQKVLMVKDFTTILNMNQMLRDEIFAILRDAYDGKTEKDFGNGVRRSYKSKFGVISGVTPAIDVYTEGNSSLGERFLRYDIPIPKSAKEREIYLSRAEDNAGKENQMREELAEIGTRVLSYDFKKIPELTPEVKHRLISLAQFVSLMRGTVIRDKFTGEATHQAFSELGTRMVKQFTKHLFGVGMYRGIDALTMNEYKLSCDMGRATIPKKMEMVVESMWKEDHEEVYSTKDIAELINLPVSTVNKTLDSLMMLGIVDKENSGGGLGKNNWQLSEDAVYLIETSMIYDIDEHLRKNNAKPQTNRRARRKS